MTNPVIECLMNHRSIREFKARALEPEVQETLLNAAIRAPSAGNLQHYSLIVVDDPQKKKAILDEDMAVNSTMFIAVVDEYRLRRWFELNSAPFYFDQAVNLLIAYWDAIAALHNLEIAAESLGLGTVYVGMVLSADLQGVLGTPPYVFPAGMLLVGYPDEAPALRPRLPLEAVVHRNGYQIPSDEQVRQFYQQKDQQWDALPEERRRKLEERGIHNIAQRVTVGHYDRVFIRGESQAIETNLKRAKFKLGGS